MKYELDPFHRDIPDEELLADLRRVAEDLGKHRVTFREYKEERAFRAADPGGALQFMVCCD